MDYVIGGWLSLGIFYLILLTYQDFKHNMLVDDRYNYFMMGATLMLSIYLKLSIWFILGVIAITIVLNIMLQKFALLAMGDTHSLIWLISGFGYIGTPLITFMVVLTICYVLNALLLKAIFKAYKTDPKPMPFFHIILISTIVTALCL